MESMMSKYKVWECKIVVPADAVVLDSPPRIAAIVAVELAGVKVVSCFSGWAGELDEHEKSILGILDE
jgi:hypothetical protein